MDELKKACEIIEEDGEEQTIPPKISNDEEIILDVIEKAKKMYGNEPVDIETIHHYAYKEGLKRDDVDRTVKKL